jgi:predicted small lipoprotein YifL
MPRLALLACLILAACGADGPPEPPSRGIDVSGEVQLGMVFK